MTTAPRRRVRRHLAAAAALCATAGLAGWQADGLLADASPVAAHPMQDVAMPMAGMPMPAARAQAAPAPVVELHRRVVYVHIQKFAFHPARIVVSPGTRIVWDNRDADPHTVHSAAGHFSSEALDTHGRYATVVRRAGSFTYLCTIHPFMHGAVIVRR